MTPTQIHYLVSFLAGAFLAGATAGLDYYANNITLDWKPFGLAVAGGVVLFARDWIKNHADVFLQNGVLAKRTDALSAEFKTASSGGPHA